MNGLNEKQYELILVQYRGIRIKGRFGRRGRRFPRKQLAEMSARRFGELASKADANLTPETSFPVVNVFEEGPFHAYTGRPAAEAVALFELAEKFHPIVHSVCANLDNIDIPTAQHYEGASLLIRTCGTRRC